MRKIMCMILTVALLLSCFPAISLYAAATEEIEETIAQESQPVETDEPSAEVPSDRPLTQEDYAGAHLIFDRIDAMEASAEYESATQAQKTEAAMALVMEAEGYIEDSLEQNGDSFTWWMEPGIRCIYDPKMRENQQDLAPEMGRNEIVNEPKPYKGGKPAGNQVYLVAPYYGYDPNFLQSHTDIAEDVAEAIGDTDGYTLYSGKSATVDKLAEAISKGAVVLLHSHGITDSSHEVYDLDQVTDAENSYVCLTSSDGLTLLDYFDGAVFSQSQNEDIVGVNGNVIARHMETNSPDGILWMGFCLGMATDTIYKPLMEKGVEVAIGYSGSVRTYTEILFATGFWNGMSMGLTVAESMTINKELLGNWDFSEEISEYYKSIGLANVEIYETLAEAREKFAAFPVVVSDEDPYPGQRTATSYGVDSLQNVQSTYSIVAERPIGILSVETSGIGVGKPIQGVSATSWSSATVEKITVYDNATSQIVSTGSFQQNRNYVIQFTLIPEAGYYFSDDLELMVDSKNCSNFQQDKKSISFTVDFTTYEEIWAVELTTSNMAVGKKLSGAKLNLPKGAEFTLAECKWYAKSNPSAGASGTFQKNYNYCIDFKLTPKPGYQFSEKHLEIQIDGDMVNSISFEGNSIKCSYTVMLKEKITKISISSVPSSLKVGSYLPQKFTYPGTSKYGVTHAWHDRELNFIGESVKIKNGTSYTLLFEITPYYGYEFAENVTVTLGGKSVKTIDFSPECITVARTYNLGLTEIDRLDINYLPRPEEGESTSCYLFVCNTEGISSEYGAWKASASNQYYTAGQTSEFMNGKYYYMNITLFPSEGYCITENTVIYANGRKFNPVLRMDYGLYYEMILSHGKLGVDSPMPAPEVAVQNASRLIWNRDFEADAFEVYRATSKNGKYTKVGTVADIVWEDTDGAAGSTFYYKVKAINYESAAKNSGFSNIVSIARKCNAPEISVENGSSGKPVVSWEKVSGAKKYTVYRATSASGKYSKLGTTTKLSYTDSEAKAGTAYFYKVIANASSSTYNSAYSNVVSCNVICGTPSVTIKIDAATGKPNLSWKKVDSAVKYRILRQLPGEADFTVIVEQTAVTFTDKTAPIDTSCAYKVQALGKTEALNGNLSKEIVAISGIAKPVVRGSIDTVTGKPVLTWSAVEGAVQYEIYRSTKSTKSYSRIETVESLFYTDTSVSAGKTYYYQVIAIGQVSKSATSSYVKLTGKCATPEISVDANTSGKPVITWEKVAGAKKYTVYRATSETGKYSKLGTTTKLTYTDSKAAAGSRYFYKVIANASSSKYNSGYSNIQSIGVACGTPSLSVKIDAATGKPALSWNKQEGAVSYAVYRDGQLLTSVAGTSYTDKTAEIGRQHSYTVQAIAKVENYNGPISKEVMAQATCAQPKVSGKAGATGKPELAWKEVEGATKYIIYRSTSSSKNYKVLDETEDLTFTDITASKGKTYYYKVVAVCEDGESAQSAYVKIKSKK